MLATKHVDDMHVLDRAKILTKAKNLDNSEDTSDKLSTVLDTPNPTFLDITTELMILVVNES
jgi:hypothetical protein